MFDLSGKRALVTGATGGIGGAIAKALHQAGATVALSGRREDALSALASELGERAVAAPCDLGDRSAVETLAARAGEALGGAVEILVNNAGVTQDMLAMRMTDEQWDKVIETNLTSSFRLSRSLLRDMMKARWGRIVSITSIVGVTGHGSVGS